MKRLAIIIAYLAFSLTAVAGTFTLMALTSSTAYAHDSDSDGGSRNVDQSRPLNATGELRVDNLAGSVRVAAWDKNEVRVTGNLGELVEKLEIEGDASSLEVKVVLPHDAHDSDCGSCADLQIQVPKGVRLEVSTVSADVQANGLTGQVQIGTVSGGIVMNSEASHIEAKTVSGDIQLVGSAKGASIDANSVSGTERLSDVDGNVDAENVSGDVKVVSRHVTGLKMSSTSGNLTFEGTPIKGGNYDLNNVSGDVVLAVGSSPDARFDISSFSGDIDNSFGPKATRVSKYSPGMELHFSSGNGSATVSARTLSGDIHLQN
ncbi:MAG TPA: DUF4097 family beta strand repeat-containing protein [Gammaproteobacteria bacterium]|nr:DUF4097 family beta strand repeat-containing protein [Gammaproteobacteria bacterium]